MSYFARTVKSHFITHVQRARSESIEGRKIIFMLPGMPEDIMFSVAGALSSYCLQQTDLLLTLKIANSIVGQWAPQKQQAVQVNGWQDERGNLTYYRNLPKDETKGTVIVLCGVDRVTDTAGLADFYTCTEDLLWRTEMKGSFVRWIADKLTTSGFPDYTKDNLEALDKLLVSIKNTGSGDLFQISDWLYNINLSGASDITDIPRIMLCNLSPFGLPVFGHFADLKKNKQLSPFISKSIDFFKYSLFLESKEREKASKAIDALLDLIAQGEELKVPLEDEEVIGSYSSGEELLLGLKNYVENNDESERERLKQCDFIVICDQILKFKIKESQGKKSSVRKLSGNPVEVVLNALWMALRDFSKQQAGNPEVIIESLAINTISFKHDIDGGDDREENDELALLYLERLIGGLDIMLQSHIDLFNKDGSPIPIVTTLLYREGEEKIHSPYTKQAEPALEFEVVINASGSSFKRSFAWRLPEHHMYRLSVDLLKRAHDSIRQLATLNTLPVFHISYYEEIFHASADEEARRVLLHSIRDEREQAKTITNLLGGAWAHVSDPLLAKLRLLSEKYFIFLHAAQEKGLFSTVFGTGGEWTDLRRVYGEAIEATAALTSINESSMIGMLVRAFLIIEARPLHLGDTWYADIHEPSGMASILHPSVIEMFESQAVYLFRCFNYTVNNELHRTPDDNSFSSHIWRSYVDISTIQSPLVGLLYNEEKNLTANVRGQDFLHCIGSTNSDNNQLSTRLLLQYSDNHEDEAPIHDNEMFRETSESKLLLRLMQDYFDLHPHARDGLSIAVYRNQDIQPIIAAVHAYLKILATKPTPAKPNKRYILPPERYRPYAISVTLFTESSDESDVSTWVQQWKERWEASETEAKYDLYRRCRFSIAHRIVAPNNLSLFQRLIDEQFEADIAVFYDFIGTTEGGNSFEKVDPFNITNRDLKFPILEKACCTVNNPAEKYKRKRVVSNRQFYLADKHANLMHSLQTGVRQLGTVVVGTGDFTPWRGLLDVLHQKAEWVICIDPNIDDRLIKSPFTQVENKREIIGFGSGVGSHGEDNYTVSTEQFSLNDILPSLRKGIHDLYGADAGWTQDDCDATAKGILSIAPELSGLSLVRATGVKDEYLRDFMAYSLTRKLLTTKENVLCESLISLDAYRHWFDLSENMSRPDLMWVQVVSSADQRLHVKLHLIECKLGKESDDHISKARGQIDNGLQVLAAAFAPVGSRFENIENEKQRPDRRYWWMQLHRLIASKMEVERGGYPEALAGLERLAEGEFEISWAASIFAFWVNNDASLKQIGYWDCPDETCIAKAFAIGGGYVRQLFTGNMAKGIDWEAFGSQGIQINEEEDNNLPSLDDDYTPWENEDSDEATGIEDSVSDAVEQPHIPGQLDLPVLAELVTPSFDQKEIATVDSEETLSEELPLQQTNGVQTDTVQADFPHSAGRIFLGETSTGQRVYWEFMHPELANRHMLIFGSSGQGKTYAIQAVLCEMSKMQQNSLIIDYTNGFLPNQLEDVTNRVLAPKQHVVYQDPLPINPFLAQTADNGGITFKENPNQIAKRIAGLFDAVYGIGSQQYSVLHRAIMNGVESIGNKMSLDFMLTEIEALAEEKQYKSSAQTLFNKLRPFVLDKPFASGNVSVDWESMLVERDPICNIFQLAGIDPYSSRLITEFILWDLYGYLQSKGKKSDPKVVVLDEVQNLDHREGSPLSKYLREGRKFGLSLILATQTMSNMKKDERDRMFNAEQKLFFKPADTELKAFAEIAALATRQKADNWIQKLSSLSKGECYSIGRVLDLNSNKLITKAIKIRIAKLEERDF